MVPWEPGLLWVSGLAPWCWLLVGNLPSWADRTGPGLLALGGTLANRQEAEPALCSGGAGKGSQPGERKMSRSGPAR